MSICENCGEEVWKRCITDGECATCPILSNLARWNKEREAAAKVPKTDPKLVPSIRVHKI